MDSVLYFLHCSSVLLLYIYTNFIGENLILIEKRVEVAAILTEFLFEIDLFNSKEITVSN